MGCDYNSINYLCVSFDYSTDTSSSVDHFVTALHEQLGSHKLFTESIEISRVIIDLLPSHSALILTLISDLSLEYPKKVNLFRDSVWESDLAPHRDFDMIENVEISLSEAQNLLLLIHGVGKHDDFRDNSQRGGYFDFKSMFGELLGTKGLLKDLPLSIHLESVEWHIPLRDSCNIEQVLSEAAPNGVKALREFTTEAVVDGLLYFSSRFGQLIIDNVAKQLNDKYREFMKSNPGFRGSVSVFAHSLGSLIMFDILTCGRKDIKTPKLDFDVHLFFSSGSPVPQLHLCRGDMFDGSGKYQRRRFSMPPNVKMINYYHPHDPIGWRFAPLLEGYMEDPILLPFISTIETKSLVEILSFYGELVTAPPLHHPIDYELPTTRYERVSELNSASTAHSSYWNHTSVAFSVVMTLCEPLIQVVQEYNKRNVQVNRICFKEGRLSLDEPVLGLESVMIEGPVKGFWKERFCVLQEEAMYIFEKSPLSTAGTLVRELSLESIGVHTKRDPMSISALSFWLYANSQSESNEESNCEIDLVVYNSVLEPEEVFRLVAKTPLEARAWVAAFEKVRSQMRNPINNNPFQEESKPIDDGSMFDLEKSGFITVEESSTWSSSTSIRFITLQRRTGKICIFEKAPELNANKTVRLKNVSTIQHCCSQQLLRLLYLNGASVVIRLLSAESYYLWVDILKRKPNSVVEEFDFVPINSCQVSGFTILEESGGNKRYASFLIINKNDANVVFRRYSEFKVFYNQLVKEVEGIDLPELPGTTFIPSLEEHYLNKKVHALNSFLNSLSQIEQVVKSDAWSAFVSDEKKDVEEAKGGF